MDCCTGFSRILLVFFNVIFMISGIGILGVGIFVIADPDSKKLQNLINIDSKDAYLSSLAYVLIAFGSFVLVVGILGFLAGFKQWKAAIVLYIMFLVIIFIGELGGGIAAAVLKGKVSDTLKTTLGNGLEKYNGSNPNSVVNIAWNAVQKELKCCGVESYNDYFNKHIKVENSYRVPTSCCIAKENKCEMAALSNNTATINNNLYSEGCLNKVSDILSNNITIVIGTAIGIAMIQLLGIVLACRVWKTNDVDALV